VDKVDTDFICPVCRRVVKEPYSLSCDCIHGFVYCLDCLMDQKSIYCSTCYKSFTWDTCIFNKFVKNKVENLLFHCKQKRRGCKDKFIIGKEGSNIKIHKFVCFYEKIKCTKCTKKLLRKDMELHVQTEHGSGPIPECSCADLPKGTGEHLPSCQFSFIDCPLCHLKINKTEFIEHIQHVNHDHFLKLMELVMSQSKEIKLLHSKVEYLIGENQKITNLLKNPLSPLNPLNSFSNHHQPSNLSHSTSSSAFLHSSSSSTSPVVSSNNSTPSSSSSSSSPSTTSSLSASSSSASLPSPSVSSTSSTTPSTTPTKSTPSPVAPLPPITRVRGKAIPPEILKDERKYRCRRENCKAEGFLHQLYAQLCYYHNGRRIWRYGYHTWSCCDQTDAVEGCKCADSHQLEVAA